MLLPRQRLPSGSGRRSTAIRKQKQSRALSGWRPFLDGGVPVVSRWGKKTRLPHSLVWTIRDRNDQSRVSSPRTRRPRSRIKETSGLGTAVHDGEGEPQCQIRYSDSPPRPNLNVNNHSGLYLATHGCGTAPESHRLPLTRHQLVEATRQPSITVAVKDRRLESRIVRRMIRCGTYTSGMGSRTFRSSRGHGGRA
jgi:hypothetical protein